MKRKEATSKVYEKQTKERMPLGETAPTTTRTPPRRKGFLRGRWAPASVWQAGRRSRGDAAAPWRGSKAPVSFFNLGFRLSLWNGSQHSFLPLPCQLWATQRYWKKLELSCKISLQVHDLKSQRTLFTDQQFYCFSPTSYFILSPPLSSNLPAPHSQLGLHVAKWRNECFSWVTLHRFLKLVSTSDRSHITLCPWGTEINDGQSPTPLWSRQERRENTQN